MQKDESFPLADTGFPHFPQGFPQEKQENPLQIQWFAGGAPLFYTVLHKAVKSVLVYKTTISKFDPGRKNPVGIGGILRLPQGIHQQKTVGMELPM